VAARGAILAAILVAALAPVPQGAAADPGRWRQTGSSDIPLHYLQGMTSDPEGRLWFAGLYVGLYRNDRRLRERARREIAIPPELTASTGYNHVGDPSWDGAGGGRLLLPLECYSPGAPGGPNTCRRGAIGVADPVTLAWRGHVELDPAEIGKAMWAEVSPDGRRLWTSSGDDLLAYRTADIVPGRPEPLRAVTRLRGAVPPSGISGAAFYGDRLLVSGRSPGGFVVRSIDLTTGRGRLEIQRPALAEPEGLDVVEALGGVLHWIVRPASGTTNRLLHFRPVGRLRAMRLVARPTAAVAGRRVTIRVRAASAGRPVAGAVIRIARRWVRTGARGTARITVRLGRGRHRLVAARPDLRPATALIRVSAP
jgi:hypothetical protein